MQPCYLFIISSQFLLGVLAELRCQIQQIRILEIYTTGSFSIFIVVWYFINAACILASFYRFVYSKYTPVHSTWRYYLTISNAVMFDTSFTRYYGNDSIISIFASVGDTVLKRLINSRIFYEVIFVIQYFCCTQKLYPKSY